MLKVNNKTPERRHWRRFDGFFVNFYKLFRVPVSVPTKIL